MIDSHDCDYNHAYKYGYRYGYGSYMVIRPLSMRIILVVIRNKLILNMVRNGWVIMDMVVHLIAIGSVVTNMSRNISVSL